MKFHLLPVGEKFEYQVEVYIKADKLIANSEKTGQNRLIARSANVQPVSSQPDSTPKVVEEHQVQTKKVLEEFDEYHKVCLKSIHDIATALIPDIKETADNKINELEEARNKFIDSLIG